LPLSSEKNDMDRPNRADTVKVQEITAIELPLRCVSNGYLSGGCPCDQSIPIRAVAAAWGRERELGRRQAGFFHFAWRGGVWLGYGLEDGRIRGVYCPRHSSQRDQRSFATGTSEIAPPAEIALSA
jgi:hypothetical protein